MSIDRPIPLDDHPVVRRKYRLPTPSIQEFYLLIEQCLLLRSAGAIIYARTRVGKTYAVLFLKDLLAQRRPNLPVLVVRCQHKRIPSELAFFSKLLTTANHKASSGKDPSKLRERLTNRLIEIADQHKSDCMIMFIDEAQHLSRNEYEWLRDAYDELELAGIQLIVFSVGQPPLKSKKSLFARDGEEQIVARFMAEELPFTGVRSAEECATCINGYDVQEYAQGSGWNHTRFFLPRAYAAGFRLALEGDVLWQALCDAHTRAAISGDPEIPMEYLTRTVLYAFTQATANDGAEFAFNRTLWDAAVSASGFERVLRS